MSAQQPAEFCLACNPSNSDPNGDLDPLCDKHEGINLTGWLNRYMTRTEWNGMLAAANAMRAMMRLAADQMRANLADQERLAKIGRDCGGSQTVQLGGIKMPAALLEETPADTLSSLQASIARSQMCPRSGRLDRAHSWTFDGDDPYVICSYCDEMRDALNGRVIRQGLAADEGGS